MSDSEDLDFIASDAKDQRVAELADSSFSKIIFKTTKNKWLASRPVKSIPKGLFEQSPLVGVVAFDKVTCLQKF